MPKLHQWFVVRGRVSIRSESSNVILELDPEESAYCVLSSQDAAEIAGIITNEARAIWDASDKQSAESARVEGDVQKSCKLRLGSQVLQIVAHDTEPLLALILDSGSHCELDIARAVAVVQLLQHMSKAVEQRV